MSPVAKRVAVVVVVIAIVGAVIMFGPSLATAYTRSSTLKHCNELKAALAAETSHAGGNADRIATLTQQIAQCTADANAAGAGLDTSIENLQSCEAPWQQIGQEWVHYKSTSYDDPAQRENTRGTMLRLGEASAQCFARSIESADTVPALTAIRASIVRYGKQARMMQEAWYHALPGVDRFGVNEPHSNDKAAAMKARVVDPLWGALAQVDSKLHTMNMADAAIAAEATLTAGNPSPPANSIFGP